MKNAIKKYGFVIIVFCAVLFCLLLFASRKAGLFCDEIYSYGLSNSYYKPFINDVKGGDMTDQVFTRQEIVDYLTVGDNDRFAFGSVYYNQTQDVHPPIYYWLLNIVSSFFPGRLSFYPALGLNLVIFLLTLFVLFKLAFKMFDSIDTATAVIMLYGLSTIAFSTFLMVRMYMLLAFWTVLLAYFIYSEKLVPSYAVIVLGLLTQYYFVFYAFFVSLFYCISLLMRKEYRRLLKFAVLAVLGVATAVAVFPACLKHIFVGNGQVVSGGNALSHLVDIRGYLGKFSKYSSALLQLKNVVAILAITLVLCVCFSRKLKWQKKPLAVILAAVASCIFTEILSPVNEIRYIYNLIPLLVLGVGYLISMVEKSSGASNAVRKAALALMLVISLYFAKTTVPDFLEQNQAEYNALCDERSGCPVVYLTANCRAPVTQDLLQLMRFDSFIVANDIGSEAVREYIGDSDRVIVYVSTALRQWGDVLDPRSAIDSLTDKTSFAHADELYVCYHGYYSGLSVTYELY